jgi:hypothetical protein
MPTLTNRPFTARVESLRARGYRYSDLASGCDDARSSAWFNNLCNSSDPWKVSPPSRDALPGLATLLGVSQKAVKEMIAEEWYGVGRTEPLSARVQALGPTVDRLSDEDFARIEDLATRLGKDES